MEAGQIELIVFGGFFRTATFDLEGFEKIGNKI